MSRCRILLLICGLFACLYINAEVGVYELKIQNHKFIPTVLTVPSGKLITLKVINLDSTVEEFESFDLKREKIIPANGSIIVKVGPLKPGVYEFFGEFNMATAKGQLIVK